MNAAEHKAEAERYVADALDEYTRPGGPIRENVNDWLAIAQVHATLATVPEPLEAVVAELGTLDATIVIGSRVVWMQTRPARRDLLVLATDTAGTVIRPTDLEDIDLRNRAVSDPADSPSRPRVWVRWDDGLASEHFVDELRVVLGV